MTNRDQAIRAQEIQLALTGLENPPAQVTNELGTVLMAGMATRLATHIRGTDVFTTEDIPRLRLVASNLGIPVVALEPVLNYLQETEMVEVKNSSGNKILEVRESIPSFGDLFDKIGSVYADRDKGEIEDATLQSYHDIAGSPRFASGQLPIEQIDKSQRVPLLDLCDQASLIRSTSSASSGQGVFYSPQYWEEHASKLPEVLQAYGDEEIAKIVDMVRSRPGFPLPERENKPQDKTLRALADFGFLPAPAVNSFKGLKSFAFTPFNQASSTDLVQNKILEKTRAIIACVRYGELYGTITSLRDPITFLERLIGKEKSGSHSEIFQQYRILIDAGVARVSRDVNFASRFHLHLIKNPENLTALNAAISLLRIGVPIEAGYIDRELHEYAKMEGDYQAPPSARAKKLYHPTGQALKELRANFIELAITH